MNFKVQETLIQLLTVSQTYVYQQDFLCVPVPHLKNRDNSISYTLNVCKENRYLYDRNEELADRVSKTYISEVTMKNARTNILKEK